MGVELEIDGAVYDFDDENAMNSFLSKRSKSSNRDASSIGNSGTFNFLRKFVQSATGGLSEPAAAGLSAFGEKNAQMTGLFPEGSDRPVKEAYEDYRGQGRESLGRFEAEHPIASGAANLAGLVTPGGAFGRLYKGGSKLATAAIPELSEAAAKTTPFIMRLLRKLGQGSIRGGTSNAAYEALNPDVALKDKPIDIGKAALIGSIIDAGISGGGETYRAGKTVASNALSAGKKYLGQLVKQTKIGKAVEAVKGQRFTDEFGNVVKKGGADTPIGAGEGFTEGVEAADEAAFKQYKTIKDPIMKRFKGDPVSPEKLRQKIVGELDDAGAIDAKGNIDYESVVFSGPEGSYYNRLAKDLDSVSSNPSMAELDRLMRGYAKLANFGKKAERTSAENMFGKIWWAGRDDLLDNAETLLVKAEQAGPQVKAAQRVAASTTKAAGKPLQGERMRAIATEDKAAAISNLENKLSEAELRGEMTSAQLREARKSFAEKQDALKRLRPMANKDPEKIIAGAKSQLTGSFIQDAVKTNPELREPLKKAVLGDLARRAKTSDQLKKAIEDYGVEPLRDLFQDDFPQLLKMAGISLKSARGPSFISKLMGSPTGRLLPRTAAPLITSEINEAPR